MLPELKKTEIDWFSKSELVRHMSAFEDTYLFSYSCEEKYRNTRNKKKMLISSL